LTCRGTQALLTHCIWPQQSLEPEQRKPASLQQRRVPPPDSRQLRPVQHSVGAEQLRPGARQATSARAPESAAASRVVPLSRVPLSRVPLSLAVPLSRVTPESRVVGTPASRVTPESRVVVAPGRVVPASVGLVVRESAMQRRSRQIRPVARHWAPVAQHTWFCAPHRLPVPVPVPVPVPTPVPVPVPPGTPVPVGGRPVPPVGGPLPPVADDWHMPPTQRPAEQRVPHAPQLRSSARGSVQVPPQQGPPEHVFPAQHACPTAPHVEAVGSGRHLPAWHESPVVQVGAVAQQAWAAPPQAVAVRH
jgi:hypothetical protein